MSPMHDAIERVRRVRDIIVRDLSGPVGVGAILAAAFGIAFGVAAWTYSVSVRTSVFTYPGTPAADGDTVPDGSVRVPRPALFAPGAIEHRAIEPPAPPSAVETEPRVARPASPVAPQPAPAATRVEREAESVPVARNAAQIASPGSERHPPGIYLLRRNGTRELLEPTVVSQVMDRNGGRTRTAIVSGVRASIRSTQQYQEFDFVFPRGAADLGAAMTGQVTSPRQFVLVQMYEEPDFDEREMDVVADGIVGPDPDVLVPFSFDQTSPGIFRVRPTEPLGIGEFGFFSLAGANPTAGASLGLALFDFGVDPQ